MRSVELRHEGVLRQFFRRRPGPDGTARMLERLAAQHRAVADGLAAADVPAEQRESLGLPALEFGIDLNGFLAGWCAERAAALRAGGGPAGTPAEPASRGGRAAVRRRSGGGRAGIAG